MTTTAPAPPATTTRLTYLDSARGLAVACMVADHITLLLHGPELVRLTLGRVAMPLFFIVAGALVRRVGWRHLGIGLVGLALPAVVPWIDAPNVLVLYALSAGVVALFRWLEVPPLVLTVCVLAASANGFLPRIGTGFEPMAVLGILAVGAHLGPHRLGWLSWLPDWLAPIGRRPLLVYVGHLLALQAVSLIVAAA